MHLSKTEACVCMTLHAVDAPFSQGQLCKGHAPPSQVALIKPGPIKTPIWKRSYDVTMENWQTKDREVYEEQMQQVWQRQQVKLVCLQKMKGMSQPSFLSGCCLWYQCSDWCSKDVDSRIQSRIQSMQLGLSQDSL